MAWGFESLHPHHYVFKHLIHPNFLLRLRALKSFPLSSSIFPTFLFRIFLFFDSITGLFAPVLMLFSDWLFVDIL